MTRLFLAAFALALAVPAPALSQAPATNATITLTSFRFTPSPIYLPAGVPVRLTLVNRAGKGHDFTAPAFFRSARIISGRVNGGMVDLDGGQSAVIELVPVRGTYKVHCSRFGHKMLGMSTTIIVS